MKKLLATLPILLIVIGLQAQELISNTGTIHFVATQDKDVDATSQSFTSKMDLDKKTVVFSIPVQSFIFASSTMQRHFNGPKAMDSKQWPKIKFVGTIKTAEDLTKNGSFAVIVQGDMTIRGTTKPLSTTGDMEVMDGTWNVSTSFNVDGTQFGITKYDFANDIAVDMTATYNME